MSCLSGLWAPWSCLFLTPWCQYYRKMTYSPDFYMGAGVPNLGMHTGVTTLLAEPFSQVTSTLLKLEFMNLAGFLGQQSLLGQQSSCLHFSSPGITGTCYYTQVLCECWGLSPRFLLLHSNLFTGWAVFCSKVNHILKVNI